MTLDYTYPYPRLLPMPSPEFQNCIIYIYITPVLKSLHRLTINQRIQYEVLFLAHKSLKTGHSSYLRFLASVCHPHTFFITINRPSVTSGLKLPNRYFHFSAAVLWNIVFLLTYVMVLDQDSALDPPLHLLLAFAADLFI